MVTVDGVLFRTATGDVSSVLREISWDVHDLVGRSAQIQIVEQAAGGWVRTATGSNDERLHWKSRLVDDLQGQSAHIEIIDHNTGSWGHGRDKNKPC